MDSKDGLQMTDNEYQNGLYYMYLGDPFRCSCFLYVSLWNQRPKKDAGGYV
jgi:hypothetical protein